MHLESALNRVQARRASPEVHLTMDVLKAGKRFQAVVGFDTDTRKTCLPVRPGQCYVCVCVCAR